MDEEQVKMVVDHYLKEKGSDNDVTVLFESQGDVERMSISTNPFVSFKSYLFGVLTGLCVLGLLLFTAG